MEDRYNGNGYNEGFDLSGYYYDIFLDIDFGSVLKEFIGGLDKLFDFLKDINFIFCGVVLDECWVVVLVCFLVRCDDCEDYKYKR